MANIALFITGQEPQYLESVDEGPYVVDINAGKRNLVPKDSTILINPDISQVVNVPKKYWKKVNTTIVEMSDAEKQAIQDVELAQRKAAADDFSLRDMKPIFVALIKVLNSKLPANKQIIKQELVDAIKAEIL